MTPFVGFINPKIKSTIVVLPLPDDPATPITSPFFISNVTLFKTSLS